MIVYSNQVTTYNFNILIYLEHFIIEGKGATISRNIFYKHPLRPFEKKGIENFKRKLEYNKIELPEWYVFYLNFV